MALIFYGMAILALLGGVGIVYWTRKSDGGMTIGMVVMAAALILSGAGMVLAAWNWR
jgi:hypothetical protein